MPNPNDPEAVSGDTEVTSRPDAQSPTDVVGHKTFDDGRGGFRHEPLTRIEADAMLAEIDAAKAKRVADMPDEQSAIRHMWDGWYRLKDFGWQEAIYCPKDGTPFEVIEAGSTGIHRCHYEGQWPNGTWWVGDGFDLYPSRPILFRPIAKATQ